MNLEEIVEGLPNTSLTYQGEPYLFEAPTKILRFVKEQGSSYYAVPSSSIFHPKGGGQPSDTGTLSCAAYSMQVKKALKAGDHVILYGKCSGAPVEGDAIQSIVGATRTL